jgi:hypothetical protein
MPVGAESILKQNPRTKGLEGSLARGLDIAMPEQALQQPVPELLFLFSSSLPVDLPAPFNSPRVPCEPGSARIRVGVSLRFHTSTLFVQCRCASE